MKSNPFAKNGGDAGDAAKYKDLRRKCAEWNRPWISVADAAFVKMKTLNQQ
jgi:hypothetical protein